MNKIILFVYLGFLFVVSVVALILYAIDKKKAQKSKWRIKEATLLTVGFFGGAIGALLGMKLVRHKTKHWYFWAINIAGFLWQMALLVWMVIRVVAG